MLSVLARTCPDKAFYARKAAAATQPLVMVVVHEVRVRHKMAQHQHLRFAKAL